MSTVIEKLKNYIAERIIQADKTLENHDIGYDSRIIDMIRYRHLELEDILYQISMYEEELKDDPTCEIDWIDAVDDLPYKAGVYLCTCKRSGSEQIPYISVVHYATFYDEETNNISLRWDIDPNVKILAWKEVKPYGKSVL